MKVTGPVFFLQQKHFISLLWLCGLSFRRDAGTGLRITGSRTLGLVDKFTGEMPECLLAIDTPGIAETLDGRRENADSPFYYAHVCIFSADKKSSVL